MTNSTVNTNHYDESDKPIKKWNVFDYIFRTSDVTSAKVLKWLCNARIRRNTIRDVLLFLFTCACFWVSALMLTFIV